MKFTDIILDADLDAVIGRPLGLLFAWFEDIQRSSGLRIPCYTGYIEPTWFLVVDGVYYVPRTEYLSRVEPITLEPVRPVETLRHYLERADIRRVTAWPVETDTLRSVFYNSDELQAAALLVSKAVRAGDCVARYLNDSHIQVTFDSGIAIVPIAVMKQIPLDMVAFLRVRQTSARNLVERAKSTIYDSTKVI